MTSSDWLPPDVVAAIESGQTIEAVKLLREKTGIGLTEAKEAVDAYVRRKKMPEAVSAPDSSPSPDLPPGVMQALQNGNRIEAVRLVREHRGLSLRDAKLFVDLLTVDEQSIPGGSRAPEAPRKSSNLVAFAVLLIIVAAFAAYLVWSGTWNSN